MIRAFYISATLLASFLFIVWWTVKQLEDPIFWP